MDERVDTEVRTLRQAKMIEALEKQNTTLNTKVNSLERTISELAGVRQELGACVVLCCDV